MARRPAPSLFDLRISEAAGLLKLYARGGVIVGAIAVGPEAGEWLGQLTLAVKTRVPLDVLQDTIQPYPTFSEAVFFASRELGG